MQSTVLDDSWSSIQFQSTDPNVLSFVDRCCLHYLDIRVRIKILLIITLILLFRTYCGKNFLFIS